MFGGMKRLIKVILLLVLPVAGCSSRDYQSQKEDLAVVNDRSIRLSDFQEQIAPLSEMKAVDTTSFNGKKQVLTTMVMHELAFQEALENNFHLDSLPIKQAVVNAWLKKKFQPQIDKITEDQVRAAYEENKSSLDTVHARHILIRADVDKPQKRTEAKKQISNIRDRITSGKITFEEAAKQYSQDGTAAKGGDLGVFKRQMMVPGFAKAAFELDEPGQISDIVETEYGYHLIKLIDANHGFSHHGTALRNKLIQETIEAQTKLYYARLKEDADVSIFYEKLKEPARDQPDS
jgi:hypothetical protein